MPRRLVPLIMLLLVLFGGGVQAQQDSTYVKRFNNRGRVNGGVRYGTRQATLRTSAGEQLRLSNSGVDFRIGGRYKWASYTFSIPLVDLTDTEGREQGKSFGLGLRLYQPQFYFRTRFRTTRGFAIEQSGENNFREDVRLFTSSIFAYYVLNHRRFSVRSSFNQRDRQLKNQGSLLLGALANYQRLKSDGLLAPRASGDIGEIQRFAQSEFGLNAGYTYTLVFGAKNKGFITPLLVGGPEVRLTTIEETGRNRERENIRIDFQYRAQLSIGRNDNRNFLALILEYIPGLDQTDALETRSRQLTAEIRLGRRF